MIFLKKDGTIDAPPRRQGLRRSLALLCLLLGVAGCILPIIPGLPFLVAAARLLGPRDRLVRSVSVVGHRRLRGLRASRRPLLRRAGLSLAPHWRSFTQVVAGRS
jgi:hypothetical protein